MARLGVGDQMLVCISAAFLDSAARRRALYVMDEPTAALTGVEAERLFAVLREIRASGRSVLYVSHRLDEVMRLCDRVTVLRDGAVVATKAIAETSQDEIIRMMIGRQVNEAYPRALAPVAQDVALAVRDLKSERLDPVSFRTEERRDRRHRRPGGRRPERPAEASRGRRQGEPGPHSGRRTGRPATRSRRGMEDGPCLCPARAPLRRTRAVARRSYENITLPHLKRFSRGGVFLSPARRAGDCRERGAEVRLKARNPRQLCHELSGGNQQKVVFAKALSGRPAVLLLDEPTRGVDVGAKFDIYSLIRELSAEGMAVLIASSDFPELLGMCDRIIVMRDGAISTVLDAEGLTEEALLNHCYGSTRRRRTPAAAPALEPEPWPRCSGATAR